MQSRVLELLRYAATSFGIGALGALVTFGVLSSFASSDQSSAESAASREAQAAEPAVATEPVDEPTAEVAAAPGPQAEATTPAPATKSAAALETKRPDVYITEGTLRRGDSLASAMGRKGVPPFVVNVIAREMRGHFDFRRAQPGHSFRLTQDDLGKPVAFRYWTSELESWQLLREGEGYVVLRDEVQLEPRVARVGGVVSSTLYGAVTELGGDPQLASDFTDIFAWDVDFSRSVRVGDEFKILYERLYRRDEDGREIYVRPGRILAARYSGAGGEHTAIYFEPEEGRGGYFRRDGSAMQRQFLMAPMRFARVTSRYSTARRHPILKVTRPHYGIDYAAPSGTPVWSVANGEVIHRGWAGGFGNLVKVRHEKGYVSYYAHLSRFAKGLRVGDRVQQKQLIGYVGRTGLATGPHVCFRITQHGKYVNPARVRNLTPPPEPLSPAARHLFVSSRDALLDELDVGPVLATTQEAL